MNTKNNTNSRAINIQKTNKYVFYIIFTIATLGLINAINLIYKHISSSNSDTEITTSLLNQKLRSAENQIRVISNENTTLQDEIESLKLDITNLTKKLSIYNNINNNVPQNSNEHT